MDKTNNLESGYHVCQFVVDESPYCVWHKDLEAFNKSIVRGISPDYYHYLLEMYSPGLENDETRQYAAIALRTAYHQSLESFFALLFASLQAPKCVFAWLNVYKTGDLRTLVTKIDNGQEILSRFQLSEFSWKSLSTLLHAGLDNGGEDNALIADVFSKLWAHFAFEFLKQTNIDEYNSIKHGFRLNLGGFGLTFGGQLIGESEFGSSFVQVKRIDDLKHHLEAHFTSVNWEPEYLRVALQGIAFSINNIRTFLKRVNGIASDEDRYHEYTDQTMYDAMLEEYRQPTIMDLSMNTGLGRKDIRPFSREEILASYC